MPSRRRRPVSGLLKVHYRGFGFVESPELPSSGFVPAPRLSGFLDGDRVEAWLDASGDKVVALRLAHRSRSQVVGEALADGTLRVDPALGSLVVPLEGSAPAGSCVLAELSDAGARLLEVVDADLLSDEALRRRVLARHGLPWCHQADALAAAQEVAATTLPRNRRQHDLVDQLVVTVDADHSVDLDDALAAAPARGGCVRVWVHVADVASRVLPGDPLDVAALGMPTSVYLPGFTRHMLPEVISANRLSLLPGVERDVLTVELLVDPEGQVRSVDVYEARIRSARRLNYQQVGTLLAHGSCDGVEQEHAELVALLSAAADRLGVARLARGGLDSSWFDPEPAGSDGSSDAHLLVERLMVAANEAVAGWLDERGMPALYRVHPGLDDAQAGELEQLASGLGLHAALSRPVSPRSMAALARSARRTAQADAFKDAMMRLAGRASYSPVPALHFGLASPRYLHFTSPLRRYADLMVHRSVKAFLAGERDLAWPDVQERAAHVSEVSSRADAAERDMKRALLARDLRPRMTVDAMVTSVSSRGVRVLVRGVAASIPGFATARPGSVIRARVRVADPLTGRLELSPPSGSADRPVRSGKPARAARQVRPAPAAAAEQSSPSPTAVPAGAGARVEGASRSRRSRRSRSAEPGARPAAVASSSTQPVRAA